MNYRIIENKTRLTEAVRMLEAQRQGNVPREKESLRDFQEVFNEWREIVDQLQLYQGYYIRYKMNLLNLFLEQYKLAHSDRPLSFSAQSLFEDGWLVRHKDTWSFSVADHTLKELEDVCPDEKMPEIFFLKCLHSFLEDKNASELKDNELKDREVPELIYEKWSRKSALLFAFWWDDICDQKDEAAREKWFHCWENWGVSGEVYRYVFHKRELYQSCMEYLKGIKSLSWTQYHNIVYHKYIMENGRRDLSIEEFEFPERPFQNRLHFYGWIDTLHSLYDAYHLEKYCLLLCRQAYMDMDAEEVRECCSYMCIPCLHLEIDYLMKQPVFLIDCLEQPELFTSVSVLLWSQIRNRNTTQLKESLTKEISQNLFDILKDGILNQKTIEWQFALNDLLSYFILNGAIYGRVRVEHQKSVSIIHDGFMKWYSKEENVQKRCNHGVLAFLKENYEACTNNSYRTYFGMEYLVWLERYADAEAGEQIFDFYKIFMQDALNDKTHISIMDWKFLDERWHFVLLNYVADSGVSGIRKFAEIISPEQYELTVQRMQGKTPLLSAGRTGLVHLYMLSELLLVERKNLSSREIEELEKQFTDCFLCYQQKECDPLCSESIAILESSPLLVKYMDAFVLLREKYEKRILDFWEEQPIEKIIACIGNIRKKSVFQKLTEILQNRIKEDYLKRIYSWSSWRSIIDTMIDLAFSDDDFKKTFVHKISEMYAAFSEAMHTKKSIVLKENQSWMKEKELQLMVLNGKEEDIFNLPDNSVNTFYKALVYLERDEVKDFIKAEELYTVFLQNNPDSYAAGANRFIADTRICVASEDEEERKKYFQLAKKHLKEMKSRPIRNESSELLLCANALCLFEKMEDTEAFWKICSEMPKRFWNDISCARYIIYTYIRSEEFENAEKVLDELEQFYGKTEEIVKLERQIQKRSVQTGEFPMGFQPELNEIQGIISALGKVRFLSDWDAARVYFRGRELSNPVESHLLKLMLETTSALSQYCDHIRFNGKAAPENYYNKLLMILFNQNQQEIYDYSMRDQSQEGTASDVLANGRQSVGSTDLWISHSGTSLSIAEGIVITGMCRTNMKKHLEKIFGYNYADLETLFIVLYADVDDISQTWKGYLDFLEDVQKEQDLVWKIRRIIKRDEIELIQKHIRNDKYVCMTEQYNSDSCIHVYHIMVDIKKYAQKKAAIQARKK